MRVVEHTGHRLGIIGISIGVFNLERPRIHDHTGERLKIAECRHDFRAGEAIHPGLVFNVDHGHDRTLQPTILADFDLLQEPLVSINFALIRNLWAELGVGELREQEFLILCLPGIGYLPADRSTCMHGERRHYQRGGCHSEYHP